MLVKLDWVTISAFFVVISIVFTGIIWSFKAIFKISADITKIISLAAYIPWIKDTLHAMEIRNAESDTHIKDIPNLKIDYYTLRKEVDVIHEQISQLRRVKS